MSRKELENLQRLRQREIELLQSRVVALGEALESGPRQWVEKHPYGATGAAAVAGFLAAQLPGTFCRKGAAASAPIPAAPPNGTTAPPASPPASGAASPAASALSQLSPLLAWAVAFAEQLLQSHAESPPATLRIANAGAVAGALFPEDFGASGPSASR